MPSPPSRLDNGEGSSGAQHGDLFDGEGSDSDDLLGVNEPDTSVLEDDFLSTNLQERVTFKRKQKPKASISLPHLLHPGADDSFNLQAPSDGISAARIRQLREEHSRHSPEHSLSAANGYTDGQGEAKDGPLDWLGDGPRQRVGYDDLTAIDWIFEYTKERQRLRMLHSRATGFIGQLQLLWDASQIWLILIATGLASGIIAAGINVASDWLADLKYGFCRAGEGGGQFYLNRVFCCWGLEEMSQCQDWTPWGTALGISARGGQYVVEYFFFVVFSVLFAVCASLLVRDYAPYAKHSGIPEIKTVLGGFVIRRFMGGWTLLIKSLGLCLSVASGMWLGKEGPLVHVSCCCANILMKFSKSIRDNEARRREVLSAAASAGISVAFGAPIGGVLFSLEQLSYYFPDKTMWQSFVCAMVAAVVLQVMNPFRTGQIVLYQVAYSTTWHNFEIFPFLLLGVMGGVYGGLFIKLNLKVARWRKNSKLAKHPVLEVFIVALVTAIINFPNIFMRAQFSELAWNLFAECQEIKDDIYGICETKHAVNLTLLLTAGIIGFFFASITFGLRLPAGIILPSMVIGALFGRTIGLSVEHFQTTHPKWLIFSHCDPDGPCVTPGTYAIIGAASALGGVTRMTASIVVIMFELTGALDYVLPIMIAVMLSKWVGDAFGKDGIYESWIHFNGYPYLDNRDDSTIPDLPASQVMTGIEDLATIASVGHTLKSLQEFLVANLSRGFPVVSDHKNNILLGYMTRAELVYAMKTARAEPRNLPPDTEVFFAHQPHADPLNTIDFRPWMDQTPMTLNSRSTLQLTVDMFMKLGLKYVLFTDKGALKGILTKKDLWYVLNDAGEKEFIGVERQQAGGRGEERELLRSPSDQSPSLFSPMGLR